MNVRVIFTVLILVSVLVMSNLSDNLAFAAEDEKDPKPPKEKKDKKENYNVLQKLVDDLYYVIDEIRAILDTLRIAFDIEVQDRTNADIALQAQIDELRILLNDGAPTTAAVSTFYINTKIITISPGENSAQTISCEDGDTATSANLVKLVKEKKFLQVFSSFQSNDNTWTFLVVNTHTTDSIDIGLTVSCLRAVE